MKKSTVLCALALLLPFPGALLALNKDEIQDRKEISQVWIDRHNADLPTDVQGYVKQIRAKKHAFFLASWHEPIVKQGTLRPGAAHTWGVPVQAKARDGAMVPLVSLRQSKAGGEIFLTANYADDLDKLHASSDIYIKIGLQFKHLFHGEGYAGCARVIMLGKDSPVFFEIGTFGGGTRCDKTIYRLDTEALKGKNDELFEHPELIDVQKYVKEELKFNVWLEGFTLYKDLGKDGTIEIVNSTDVMYPPDLKTKIEERYKMVDNDFAGAFRQNLSIYRWDDTKAKFLDLGDFYYY